MSNGEKEESDQAENAPRQRPAENASQSSEEQVEHSHSEETATEQARKEESGEKELTKEQAVILNFALMGLQGEQRKEFIEKYKALIVKGNARLNEQLSDVVAAISASSTTEGQDSAALLSARNSMQAGLDSGKGLIDSLSGLTGTLGELKTTFKDLNDTQYRQLLQQHAQFPPELQVPTVEIMAMERLVKEEKPLSYQRIKAKAAELLEEKSEGKSQYEKHVERWYKKLVREVEAFDTTFEERPQHLSPLLLTVTHLELRPETRALGERLRKNLEARRIDKSMARVWDIALPSQIGSAASQLHLSTLKELFTSDMYDVIDPKTGKKKLLRDSEGGVVKDKKTGKPVIERRSRNADAFREYEAMGNEVGDMNTGIRALQVRERQISEQRDNKGNPKKLSEQEQEDLRNIVNDRLALEEKRKEKVRYIQRCYKEGGDVEVSKRDESGAVQAGQGKEKMSISKAITKLEDQRKRVQGKVDEERQRIIDTVSTDEERVNLAMGLLSLEELRARKRNGEIEKDSDEEKQLGKLEKKKEFKKVVKLLDAIDSIDAEHETCEDRRQAMIIAGGIYRYTFRGATNDIAYMTGDFFAGRALNLGDRVAQRYGDPVAGLTRGILDPVTGKFAGEMLDFKAYDYWEDLFLERAKVKEEKDTTSAEGSDIVAALTGRVVDEGYLGDIGVERVGRDKLNLEGIRLEDESLWNNLIDKYGVPDNWYAANQLDMYTKVDETRGAVWQAGSFFQDPNVDSLLELKKVMTHLNERKKKEFFGELVERSMEWMKNDPKAKEAVEDLLVFPESEKFAWIEETSNHEMITNEFRNELFAKYLDFPLGGGSPRDKAQRRVLYDTLLAVWRWKPMRGQVLSDSFLNLLKRAFGYAFAEDIGARA